MESTAEGDDVGFTLIPGQYLIGFFLSNTLSTYHAVQYALHEFFTADHDSPQVACRLWPGLVPQ